MRSASVLASHSTLGTRITYCWVASFVTMNLKMKLFGGDFVDYILLNLYIFTLAASLAKYFMQSPFSMCCTTQPPWRNLVQESRDRQILFEVQIYLQKGFYHCIKGCIK